MYRGDKVYLRAYQLSDAPELARLRKDNREFFARWEPIPKVPLRFTVEEQSGLIERMRLDAGADIAYAFAIFKSTDDRLVGQIRLSNVARSAWQNATVGYFVAEKENSCGFATEAVRMIIRIAFEDLSLHRLQSGVIPRNIASNRVMEKAGFRLEGFAPHYLQINGVWEGHNLYAITQEDVASQARDQSG